MIYKCELTVDVNMLKGCHHRTNKWTMICT